jgi:FkbH-like protein
MTLRIADLYWLPEAVHSAEELRRLVGEKNPLWEEAVSVARNRLDFVQTMRLGRVLQRCAADAASKTLRIALLGSSTSEHLIPGLRVAAARRQFRLETWVGGYGLYLQELEDRASPLHEFAPDVILFAFHAQSLFGNPDPALLAGVGGAHLERALDKVRYAWRLARDGFKGQIIQQTVVPAFRPLMGLNEHRLQGSAAELVERLNEGLRRLADEERVDILAIDRVAAEDGIRLWHDPVLWHRAKQEISPVAGAAYGDLVLRLVGAQQGRSSKCLVLDLDNTLWGGVIGDDGLEGIKLGQGSALGEAFVEFQTFARDLARRGVILAVCSKNDEANARAPFENHPDMVLKLKDVACFVANWTDKAANLRSIAEQLNIGIDSLVFADDNPFERNIIRRELPLVAVPELPQDPALYSRCLADAGYFEALQITSEDFERGGQYRANVARETLRASHTDLAGYLKSLDMELRWQPFDRVGLQRIVQLINKTNQFNLTTRRYTEAEVLEIMNVPRSLTLQLRLLDQFGDNGIIGIVIGKPEGDSIRIDTWLMSCRVLGRQVEEATVNLVVAEARRLRAERLVGEYIPTKKNSMVKDHYSKLGFRPLHAEEDGRSTWALDVAEFEPFPTFMRMTRSA